MEDLLQPVLNGVLLGGIYAAVGIGLSMIFGIVKLVNLAHGDLMIVATYLALAIITPLNLTPYLALVAVVPIMFGLGYLIQRHLLNRVLGKGMEPPLIVAFGVSIILQNTLLLIFSPDARSLKTSLVIKSIPISETFSIPLIYLVGFMVGVLVIAALHIFFKTTFLGRAIRAASDDEEAAQYMGVNTRRIYAYAMGIAMMTAAVAGVLVGTTFTFFPHTGPQYLIIAFGVVIIGGAGSMVGTLAGGVILGLAQLLGSHFLGSGYQLLFGYVVLLAVLTFRPQGLFGKAS
ncbi:MAG: branched-chain amino acid ABC transporter permease [Desulfarculaceae bacterium]|jgi:branched-chain amino acid transport system permease protein